MTTKQRIAELTREVKAQRRLLVELARTVHTHVRTDLPPDACLPRMSRLLAKIKGGR